MGVTTVIQFINIGRVGDKSFKEWRRKIGGWKGGWQQYFDFFMLLAQQKCHFKKLHFGQLFLFVSVSFVIHRLLYWFESFGTRPETEHISQFLVVQISSTGL